MISYQRYCEDIKRLGGEITYTEEEYLRKHGVTQEFEPMIITPKNQKRPMKATFENSEKELKPKKQKAVKPPKEKKEKIPKEPKPKYKRPKIYTDEEIKQRRKEAKQSKRAQWIAQGLTSRGTPRILKQKQELSIEETRLRRAGYARAWREKHREKHLAYRRSQRAKEAAKRTEEKYRQLHPDRRKEQQRIYAKKRREQLKAEKDLNLSIQMKQSECCAVVLESEAVA